MSEPYPCSRCGRIHPDGPCPTGGVSETLARPQTVGPVIPPPVVKMVGATMAAPEVQPAPSVVPRPLATVAAPVTAPSPVPSPQAPSPPPIEEVKGDPLIGQTVGSFKLVRALGRGGMGTVYAAEHPVIGSKVAIKFLHTALASNEELVRRFYDEARAVNLIGNENIVSIFDLNLLPPNRYYIVMEYLDGQTLAERLDRER